VATLQLYEYNGHAPIATRSLSRVDFLSTDVSNGLARTYPITVPASGSTTYAYEKWLKIVVLDMGAAVTLSNFRIWFEPDEEVQSHWSLLTSARPSSYVNPTPYAAPKNTVSTWAASISLVSDIEPASVNVGVGGSLSATMTAKGDTSDFIVIQASVSSADPFGLSPVSAFSGDLKYSWDES
jgi:hypothetical protein